MTEIKKTIQRRLDIICNQFITEKIGENELNLMPPIDKVPIISRLSYDKNDDAFEIYFNECNNYVLNSKGGIDFWEDKSGHLMVIRIRNFSKLNVDEIKLDILTTIENEIHEVVMRLTRKENILDNIVEKRKLMFLDNMVKQDYNVLMNEFVN